MIHDPDLDRYCQTCGADCELSEPLHADWCPTALGLSIAAGDERCGHCSIGLDRGERYVSAADGDGYTSAGLPRCEVLCLGCAVLAGAR